MQGHRFGLEQQVQSRLIRLVALIQQYLGERWRPDTILLETETVPSELFVEVMDGPLVIPNAGFSAVPISRALLARGGPLSRAGAHLDPVAPSGPGHIDWTWLDCLRAVLPEYIMDNACCIGTVAEIANVSSRTLQRALAEQGMTFRQLLDNARFELARQKLADPSIKIDDIGRLLGYSESTHFTRAFRRIAGRTPSEYRWDLLSQS